ncbi:MAG: hypothetical protein ACRC3B_18600 [Bacteroidia bacterium]
MRCFVLLTALLFFLPAVAADYTYIFSTKTGSTSMRVLRLRSDNVYEYLTYTKKKATRDTGSWEMRGRKLELVSTMKKHGPNPLLRKTLFVSEKGLYEKRTDIWLKRKPKMPSAAGDAKLQNNWLVNPLTGTTLYAKGANATADKPADLKKQEAAAAVYVQPANAGTIAKQFYINTAARYTPGYDNVLREAYCGPDCYYHVVNDSMIKPIIDTASAKLFSDFETVIHESVHTYNRGGYLIVPGVYISVPATKAYKTSLFTPVVPADASEKIFRYKTYVDSTSRVSANVSGIYGLLDEYSAYFNGVHSCLNGAKQALKEGDTALARSFVQQASGTAQAHYEFRLFIAWYVHYASLREKEAYNAMMGNTNLRVVFTLLDNEFRKTLDELQKINAVKGINTYGSFDTSYYTDTPADNYLYKNLKPEEKWLNQLKIKGVTLDNYQKHIKTK